VFSGASLARPVRRSSAWGSEGGSLTVASFLAAVVVGACGIAAANIVGACGIICGNGR